ncbi:GDP-mannose 3,5-epimerase 2 [Micractinium conductrix]|uniref:Pescadillo homolog n=1 Tax=Micractinium conductrix TaxID=554055 RepID=A0A2P6VFG2_9CHLO|nr:GDP-mannose 3,5-epimerase 2 [Micractinium conductrix]|eukprot:PSC72835.1 GDP-mannose 3,5-epimerase 2 [Micractinium conductrix]
MLKKKKGTEGNAVQYLTRNQALKKLQLHLSEFRRLCILKGVHPREPKKKPQGHNKTYYHVKDIAYLLHEPLLKKARELAAYDKKVRRAKAKQNRDLAARLAARKPTYRLDHLVRERYPSFVDALRDLDDPLTMVHLFAVLPAERAHGIPAPVVALARRLALEWQAWVVRAHALRKTFISVKGYYYQAEVQGQVVTWLVPHATSQVLPPDVDYKVMLTFLEFYQTLLQFVNFKLYHSLGLRYPPALDGKLEAAAAGLEALMHDLAAAPSSAAGEPAAAGGGEADGGEERQVNPEAQQRIGSLADKVRELEEEIQRDRPRAAGAAGTAQQPAADAMDVEAGEAEEEEAVEEEAFEIDSGGESSDEEEEAGGEEDAAAGDAAAVDPTDAQLAGSAGAADSDGEEAEAEAEEEDGEQLAGGAADVDPDDDAALCAALFKGLFFFLGREVPREQLLLVIRAFGGEAGWAGEGSPLEEGDERITHQVVDRPTQGHRFLSREYVQPQWVFDSVNFRVLAKPSLYAPGAALPPHLSPFVSGEEEGYVPEYGRQLGALAEAARAARRRRAAAGRGGDVFIAEEGEGGDAAAPPASLEEEMEAAEARHAAELAKELKKSEGAAAGAESDDEAAAPVPAKRKRAPEADVGADEAVLRDVMMTRKTKKMYQGLKKREAEKAARVAALEAKAAAIKGGKRKLASFPFEPYWPEKKLRICITGAGGFIASHLAKRLKSEGHYIVGCDWKRNEHMPEEVFCDEFILADLRVFDNCAKVVKGCDHVFSLAADMGGMGFIQSNHSVILYNNTMISFNMMEAARQAGVTRFFYASSACIYPEHRQLDTELEGGGLKESDAWPAQPQDAYGLEKLVTEELCMHYEKDFGIACRTARFHNIYGPYGTWKGGREKAPAAFCRKALTAVDEIEMWGDGKQTRSFTFIDDCVEGILRITKSDYRQPLNLGSDEMVSMNGMMEMVMGFDGMKKGIKHIPGPEGVRGRNSDNKLILEKLGWAPTIKLEDGLRVTYKWIKGELEKESKEGGKDLSEYSHSMVVGTQAPKELGTLRAADGAEGLSDKK